MKCFLITWVRNPTVSRQKLLDYIDTKPQITNWRAGAGAIFVVGDLWVDDIEAMISGKFPDLRFLVTLLDIDQIEGRLDRETWDFIEKPQSA